MHIVHFDENMLIGDAADLDAFMEMYGVEAVFRRILLSLRYRFLREELADRLPPRVSDCLPLTGEAAA